MADEACSDMLPVTIQVGEMDSYAVAYIEREPAEQFQARLAAVLLEIALGILTSQENQ